MGGMGGEEDEVKNARARMVAEGDEWKSIDIFQLFPFPQLWDDSRWLFDPFKISPSSLFVGLYFDHIYEERGNWDCELIRIL